MVRGEEVRELRRAAIVIVSALLALTSALPASADTEGVSFTDVEGDLGHPAYDENMVPSSYWPATSPVGSSGYLDMLGGWIDVDDEGIITAALAIAYPLTGESVLPEGVKAVWWTWFFSKDTSVFSADYAVHVCWDGSAFGAFVLVRGLEDPVRPVISFLASGNSVAVEFDGDLVVDSVGWFAESICWNHSTPHTDQGYMPSGGWFAADITDGPFLPWLAMPG